MPKTYASGLLGSALTFTLLLTAGGTWFTANALSSHAPDVVATISQVSLVAGVLAVVAFGLTLRSLLSSDGPTRDYRRPSRW